MTVRSARRVLSMLHFLSSSKETSAIEENIPNGRNPARPVLFQELQRDDEGKTSRMGLATRIVPPRRGSGLEREVGLDNSSSSIKDLSARLIADEARPSEVVKFDRNEIMAERARATGEAHFEDVKSADGPITPSSVLGRTTSADGPTRRLPVQLTHNRVDDRLASTDGKMTPARAESTETSELFENVRECENVREFGPLIDGALDTVEGRLQQTRGSSVEGHLQQTTDSSEAATAVVLVELASARTVVYSNFNSMD